MNKTLTGLSLSLLLTPAAFGACVSGASGTPPGATISFTAPTKNTDGTAVTGPLTYNVYQGVASGAEVKVASGAAGSPIQINTGLSPNTTYYWYVTVVEGTGESGASNEVCKSFPASLPGVVTITIT